MGSIRPEQAIEDPVHGSEAVIELLSIPPYPNEDGTYYVFGGLYTCGTTSFDAGGQPFIKIDSGRGSYKATRDSLKNIEWVEKWRAGELPSIDEMGYPVFQLEAAPRLITDTLTLE